MATLDGRANHINAALARSVETDQRERVVLQARPQTADAAQRLRD